MGVNLQKCSSHHCAGVTRCDSLPREATRCQNMPKREESFHRVYSRTPVLAQAMLSLCSHLAFSASKTGNSNVRVTIPLQWLSHCAEQSLSRNRRKRTCSSGGLIEDVTEKDALVYIHNPTRILFHYIRREYEAENCNLRLIEEPRSSLAEISNIQIW